MSLFRAVSTKSGALPSIACFCRARTIRQGEDSTRKQLAGARPGWKTGVWVGVALAVLTLAGCPEPPLRTLLVDGKVRTFRLYVPANLPWGKDVPLVIALHGFSDDSENAAEMMDFEKVADREGFVVAYPGAQNRTWRYRPQEQPIPDFFKEADDVAFIRRLIDHLTTWRHIDRSRIYIAGFSNGGFMTYRLACDLGDTIAGAAAVCANLTPGLVEDYRPTAPVPMLVMCGTEDPIVPWEGGTASQGPAGQLTLLSAEETGAQWAEWNGCAGTPVVEELPDLEPADDTRVERVTYGECGGDSDVALYNIVGGGHSWPGTARYMPPLVFGRTSKDISASEVIWEFFSSHTVQ